MNNLEAGIGAYGGSQTLPLASSSSWMNFFLAQVTSLQPGATGPAAARCRNGERHDFEVAHGLELGLWCHAFALQHCHLDQLPVSYENIAWEQYLADVCSSQEYDETCYYIGGHPESKLCGTVLTHFLM